MVLSTIVSIFFHFFKELGKKIYMGKNVLEFHDSWRSSITFYNSIDQKLGKNRWVPFASAQPIWLVRGCSKLEVKNIRNKME
jgi:hypothetical protein